MPAYHRRAGMSRNELDTLELGVQRWHQRSCQQLIQSNSHIGRCLLPCIQSITFEMQYLQSEILLLIYSYQAIQFDRQHTMDAVGVNMQIQAQDNSIVGHWHNAQIAQCPLLHMQLRD